MKKALKNALYFLLYYSGACGALFNVLSSVRKSHPCIILLYHQIVDKQSVYLDKGPAVHHPIDEFRKEIQFLARHVHVATMDEVIERISSGRGFDRPTVAITFDDGYRDNYTLAFPVLKKYAVPAIIYLTTGLIDTMERTWPDQIETAVLHTDRTNLFFPPIFGDKVIALGDTDEKRRASKQIAEALKLIPDDERMRLLRELFKVLDVDIDSLQNMRRAMLTWEEVREMSGQGIIFGSHSHTHPILSRVPLEQAKADIQLSKDVLEKKLQKVTKHFAYPNGRLEDFSVELGEYCRQIGFESVATVVYGGNGRGSNVISLKRIGAYSPAWWQAGILSYLMLTRF